MQQHQWFDHACDALLMIEEAGLDWPAWLVTETRKLGARRIQRWLSDESVTFSRYEAGLALAEHCGVA